MSEWETVALGDVAEINPRDGKPNRDALISFVGMADLDETAAVTTPGAERQYHTVSKGYTQFLDGDILAAKITPCWENGKIGMAKLAHEIGVGSTEFHVIRSRPKLDSHFAMRFLRTPRLRINGELRMTGSGGQRRVPTSFLSSLRIPLPPVKEQRRIAAILDEADAIRAKRRSQLAHLDELPQALFHEMFGRSFNTARRYRLGDLVSSIDNGTSPSCESRPAEPHEWGILKLGAVTYGEYRHAENKAYLGSMLGMERNEVRPGDVLMTRKNTRELVGAVSVVDDTTPEKRLLPDLIFRLHLDADRLDPHFFQAYMMHRSTRIRVQGLASGSAASMPNISKARLKTLEVALPDLADQKVFASHISAIRTERARVARALQADDELFASLQYRAFRGEL